MKTVESSKLLRYVGGILLLATLYFITGKLGLMLATVHPSASAVWPPTAITLASFLVFGNRIWPGILLGAFLVNLTTAGAIATSLGIAIGNTLEGMVGAYLVRKFANGIRIFERAHDTLSFIVLAAMLSTMVSATVGVTCLTLNGLAHWEDFRSIWLTWWLGDAVSCLILAPPLILWSLSREWTWKPGQIIEAGVLLILLVSVGLIVFGEILPVEASKITPLVFMCAPILIWAAFRFEQREIQTGNLMLSGIALWGTLQGLGPFGRMPQNESILMLQSFMGITTIMCLTVTAIVTERNVLVRELTDAVEHVKTLRGLLPICASCKKIRNDRGYWQEVETYLHDNSEVTFTHGICPDCLVEYKSKLLKRKAHSPDHPQMDRN